MSDLHTANDTNCFSVTNILKSLKVFIGIICYKEYQVQVLRWGGGHMYPQDFLDIIVAAAKQNRNFGNISEGGVTRN